MTDHRYAAAQRRVDRLVGLTVHVLAFVLVNIVLFAQAGVQVGAGHFWGWGIGVGAHALAVLGPGARLKQRAVQRELDRSPETHSTI